MSNNSLAEELFQQLQGAPLQQVSQQLGTGQMQTASAISAALPPISSVGRRWPQT